MTAPERIEIYIVGYEQNAQYDPYWHMPSGDDCAIEYIRADLAAIATQPDPRDEVINGLVEAAEAYVNRSEEYRIISTDRGGSHGPKGKAFIAVGDAYSTLVDALAAVKAVVK